MMTSPRSLFNLERELANIRVILVKYHTPHHFGLRVEGDEGQYVVSKRAGA